MEKTKIHKSTKRIHASWEVKAKRLHYRNDFLARHCICEDTPYRYNDEPVMNEIIYNPYSKRHNHAE